jgi:hypothetical protein
MLTADFVLCASLAIGEHKKITSVYFNIGVVLQNCTENNALLGTGASRVLANSSVSVCKHMSVSVALELCYECTDLNCHCYFFNIV